MITYKWLEIYIGLTVNIVADATIEIVGEENGLIVSQSLGSEE